MEDVLSTKKGNKALFPKELVKEVFSKVKGKSSLIKVSKQIPIPFNGTSIFIFNMDNEIDLVAENGKKTHGGVTLESKIVTPYKIEYGARISNEFMYASKEAQIDILRPFVESFSKKVGKGLDLMAMHGVNPRTGVESEVIGNNNFDKLVTTTINFTDTDPGANLETAIAAIQGEERDINGMILSPIFTSAMAKRRVNGVKEYPEFSFGQAPETLSGLNVDSNVTVSAKQSKDRAIVGDFETMFKWGYSQEIPMEIIEYGDPDNTGKDLKGHNQIYIRCEAYIAYVILDEKSFARIVQE